MNECKWCGDPIAEVYFCSQDCRVEWFDSPTTDRLGDPKPYNAHPVFKERPT